MPAHPRSHSVRPGPLGVDGVLPSPEAQELQFLLSVAPFLSCPVSHLTRHPPARAKYAFDQVTDVPRA